MRGTAASAIPVLQTDRDGERETYANFPHTLTVGVVARSATCHIEVTRASKRQSNPSQSYRQIRPLSGSRELLELEPPMSHSATLSLALNAALPSHDSA